MKSVLVTGAAGFIGSHLVDELLSRGYFVVGVDNLFRGTMDNLRGACANRDFRFEKLDLADDKCVGLLRGLIKTHGIKSVFHLAAINGTQYFYDASWMVLDVNVRTTQNLLAAVEGSGVKYLAYTSSSEVYGEPMHVPTPESHPILLNADADRDSYASSKALGDYYFRIGAKKLGLNAIVYRVFNQYGPRMVGTKYGQVIGEFVTRALSGTEFTIIGDGSHTRSFCLVSDAARVMVSLHERGTTGFLNLGNDVETSILELAKIIHLKLDLQFDPVFLAERPHDHRRRCPDLAKLRRELPDFHLTSLDQGLDVTIASFRQMAQ